MNGNWQDHYPYFEANQVLTNEHLNELSDFLDEQNRISRAQLIGVGIGCGLTFELNGSRDKLTVFEGFGITSEGYLLCHNGEQPEVKSADEEKGYSEYTRFRVYTDPSHDQYWYNPPENAPVQLDLFELLTENQAQEQILTGEAEPGDILELSDAPADFFQKKVLVLYMELYDKSLKSCVGNDCDNKGQDRYLRPKLLLAKQDDLAAWLGVHCRNELAKVDIDEITIYEDASLPQPMAVPRFAQGLIKSGIKIHEINKYAQISGAYDKALSGYPAQLETAIEKAFDQYGGFLGLTDKGMNLVEGLSSFNVKAASAQFDHDFFKDLTEAYNEFIELARELKRDCFNDTYVFCRHLMVGTPLRNPDFNKYYHDRYRNYFQSTSITPAQDRKFRKAQMLFERMLEMISGYEPIIHPPKSDFKWVPQIIPSQENEYPLGKGAIPDYFNKNDQVKSLYKVWDPDKYLKEQENFVRSFDHHLYAGTVPDEVVSPLVFNTDQYPFYRFDSLLGRDAEQARLALESLKSTWCLPFNVVSLRLNGPVTPEEVDMDCYFEDIQADYLLLRQDLACLIDKFEACLSPDVLSTLIGYIDISYEITPANFQVHIQNARLELAITTLWDFLLPDGAKGQSPYNRFKGHMKWLEDVAAIIAMTAEWVLDRLLSPYVSPCDLPSNRKKEKEAKDLLACLNQFLKSCALARLAGLSAIFSHRWTQVLDQHPLIFANFARKHPGMEHLGGVPKGGTFILIYPGSAGGKGKTNTRVVADFSLPYLCCADCTDIRIDRKTSDVKIPPVGRVDWIILAPGEDAMIPVLVNDTDPLKTTPESLKVTNIGEVQAPKGAIPFVAPPQLVETAAGATISVAIAGGEVKGDNQVSWFDYEVTNPATGLKDYTRVFVMVKKPDMLPIHAANDYIVATIGEEIQIPILENDCFKEKEYGGTVTILGKGTALGASVKVVSGGKAGTHVLYKSPKAGEDIFSYKITYPATKQSSTAIVRVKVIDPCDCCREMRIFSQIGYFTDLLSAKDRESGYELRFIVNDQLTLTPIQIPIDMVTHLAVTMIAIDTQSRTLMGISSARPGHYQVEYAVVELPKQNGDVISGAEPTIIRKCVLDLYDIRTGNQTTGGATTGTGTTGTVTGSPTHYTGDFLKAPSGDISPDVTGFDSGNATHVETALLLNEVKITLEDTEKATEITSGQADSRLAEKYTGTLSGLKEEILRAETPAERETLEKLYAETLDSMIRVADSQEELSETSDLLKAMEGVQKDLKDLQGAGFYDPKDAANAINQKLTGLEIERSKTTLRDSISNMTKLG